MINKIKNTFEKSIKGLKQKRIKELNKLIDNGYTFEQLRFRGFPENFIKEHSKK